MKMFSRLVIGAMAMGMLVACAAPTPASPNTQVPTSISAQVPAAVTAPPAPTSASRSANTPVPSHAPTTTTAPTGVPAATMVVPPTSAPTSAPTAVVQPTSAPTAQVGSELLFLRGGVLTALDMQSKQERQIADNVRDFAATPDGSTIALICNVEGATDLWTVKRDGSGLTQLTTNGNQRMEAMPSWAPDGSALVFASSTSSNQYTLQWPAWGAWCAVSEVHIWEVAQQSEMTLAPGCDPAFGPDGKRIAYAAPPTQQVQGLNTGGAPAAVNTIRLINRQGQNGWDFARADGQEAAAPNNGHVVYGPAWSPDGSQVVYHRFLGYQALVDIDMSEIAASFKGSGQSLATGAGWLLPAIFAPDGSRVAIIENNYSDARGFGGYDNWSVEVISTSGSRSIQLPSQTVTAVGQSVDMLRRAQHAVWSPTGDIMAVQLPPDWKPDLSANEPLGIDDVAGEVWLWQPGNAPQQRVAQNVDFASPLAWLPAAQ